MQTLAGTPPGQYDLVVTLFDKETLAPLTITDSTTGNLIGPAAVIGRIEIINPDTPPDFMPQYPAEQDFPALGLRLLGYNQDRADAAPGEPVLLTLFWRCLDAFRCEHFVLRLVDESSVEVEAWRLPVIREGFTSSAWPDQGWLRGQIPVLLPADLASGRYRFLIEDFPLGEVTVTAPDRQFTAPPLGRQIASPFSNLDDTVMATLVGVTDSTLPQCAFTPLPAGSCSLPLVWRAEADQRASRGTSFDQPTSESGRRNFARCSRSSEQRPMSVAR